MPQQSMFDDVANDLALWIDETASKVALALAPRTAPFAVQLTEAEKLDIYTRLLFNPDGSPNEQGRAREMARLGAEGFAQVYKAVTQAHPELKPRVPDNPDSIEALAPMPAMPPGAPPGPPPAPIPMASGGIVTQPTVALIGEAGPEAVVPLTPGAPTVPMPPWQPPAQGEIQNYIDQAARQRGIDPQTAVAVAYHEGGLDEPARRGAFSTGSSWWPYQLHYGGPGYEQYGNVPGMGNEFTAQTGWQPGDPRAWQASTDYALDQALKYGWGRWYGAQPAGVSQWQGLPRSG